MLPIVFGGIAIAFAAAAWLTAPMWYPGLTPTQTASILVRDSKFGGRALWAARLWGDDILTPLRSASNDFSAITSRNASLIAAILTHSRSRRSHELSRELYLRPSLLAKLVGAVGLAAHDDLPKSEFSDGGFLFSVLSEDRYVFDSNGQYADTAPIELALVAAQTARCQDSVDQIIAILERRPAPYWVHAHACCALAAIGDKRAVPPLENAMRAQDFYAVTEGFVALHKLASNQSIPLAIERITPRSYEDFSIRLVNELERATGQRFRFDRDRWRKWWAHRSNGAARSQT